MSEQTTNDPSAGATQVAEAIFDHTVWAMVRHHTKAEIVPELASIIDREIGGRVNMEVKTMFPIETKQKAQELLDADMLMQHVIPDNSAHCVHCGKWRELTRLGEECPGLLRCALEMLRERLGREGVRGLEGRTTNF
jgi:hypothetical protein